MKENSPAFVAQALVAVRGLADEFRADESKDEEQFGKRITGKRIRSLGAGF
jgi:hypothetical protein